MELENALFKMMCNFCQRCKVVLLSGVVQKNS